MKVHFTEFPGPYECDSGVRLLPRGYCGSRMNVIDWSFLSNVDPDERCQTCDRHFRGKIQVPK